MCEALAIKALRYYRQDLAGDDPHFEVMVDEVLAVDNALKAGCMTTATVLTRRPADYVLIDKRDGSRWQMTPDGWRSANESCDVT